MDDNIADTWSSSSSTEASSWKYNTQTSSKSKSKSKSPSPPLPTFHIEDFDEKAAQPSGSSNLFHVYSKYQVPRVESNDFSDTESDDDNRDDVFMSKEIVGVKNPYKNQDKIEKHSSHNDLTIGSNVGLCGFLEKKLLNFPFRKENSISTSINKIYQHFKLSVFKRGSVSCSNTPLRNPHHPERVHGYRGMTSFTSSSSSSSSSSTSSVGCKSYPPNSAKKQKQKSILRPPIRYVYIKGMSGLYSKVPSYAVSCPAVMQQLA